MTLNAAARIPDSDANVDEDLRILYEDGIVGKKGVFSRDWTALLHEDMMKAYHLAHENGTSVNRGPMRWYVELHPEAIRGFTDIVTDPWINAMAESVLGPDYKLVEIGLDVPFQGAEAQDWHRDFPSPVETYQDRKITSLAFNLTGVDVTQDMGPFEVAPGTHWDDGRSWKDEMFPPESEWNRYIERAVRKYPQMGDVSCRSALTIHHGTAHASPIPRPVLVVAYDAPGAGHDKLHDLMVTKEFYASLPQWVREHMICRVVDKLEVIVQKHQLEGLKEK